MDAYDAVKNDQVMESSEHVQEFHYRLVSDTKDISERNLRQIQRLYGHVQKHDTSGLPGIEDEMMAQNIRVYGPATGSILEGIDAVKDNDKNTLQAYPHVKLKINQIFAHENKVVVWWTWNAVNEGEYLGRPPTHKEVTLDGIYVYCFNSEGKIIEIWASCDRLAEYEQLGIIHIGTNSQK